MSQGTAGIGPVAGLPVAHPLDERAPTPGQPARRTLQRCFSWICRRTRSCHGPVNPGMSRTSIAIDVCATSCRRRDGSGRQRCGTHVQGEHDSVRRVDVPGCGAGSRPGRGRIGPGGASEKRFRINAVYRSVSNFVTVRFQVRPRSRTWCSAAASSSRLYGLATMPRKP